MLDSDRDAQQARADTGGCACFGGHRGVGHGRRVGDQAFDPAERFGEAEQLQPVEQAPHRRFAAGELERQHCAKPVLLARGDVVAGMVGKPRIMDLRYRRMRAKLVDDDGGILLMLAHPHVERSQPAQGQETVERCACDPDRVGPPGKLFMDRGVLRDNRAADHVAVAIDIFGGRMDDDVGAELKRALQHWREEGIVDHDQRADRLRGGGGGDIGDPHQRVRRGLDP